MKKLLLISNSVLHGSGYLDHCLEEIDNFLADKKDIIFIPFALKDWDWYESVAKEKLAEIGRNLVSIHKKENYQQAIMQAPAIFIGGGNTFRLLKHLYDHDLVDLIKDRVNQGMLYMGASAGSNVATVDIKTTNDMPIVFPKDFTALNLVPFNINPHYIEPDSKSMHKGETRDKRIKEFLEENENPVVAIREGALLRLEGESLHLKGSTGAKIFYPGGEVKEFEPISDLSFLLK